MPYLFYQFEKVLDFFGEAFVKKYAKKVKKFTFRGSINTARHAISLVDLNHLMNNCHW